MFVIGGGRDPEGVRVSHAPFLEASGGEVGGRVEMRPGLGLGTLHILRP